MHYILIKPCTTFLSNHVNVATSRYFEYVLPVARVLMSRRRRNVALLWYHTYRKVASWHLWYRVIALSMINNSTFLRKIVIKIKNVRKMVSYLVILSHDHLIQTRWTLFIFFKIFEHVITSTLKFCPFLWKRRLLFSLIRVSVWHCHVRHVKIEYDSTERYVS